MLVVLAVAVPVQIVMDEVAFPAQVFEDVDFGARPGRIADVPAHRRRLEPERRPVPDLLLELDATLEVAERRLEEALRADHGRVDLVAAAPGRQDQVTFPVQRHRLLDVDGIPAGS